MQLTYQMVPNFITYPNMWIIHANEIQKYEFKCEMQNHLLVIQILEINILSFVIQKITNKMLKCSAN